MRYFKFNNERYALEHLKDCSSYNNNCYRILDKENKDRDIDFSCSPYLRETCDELSNLFGYEICYLENGEFHTAFQIRDDVYELIEED